MNPDIWKHGVKKGDKGRNPNGRPKKNVKNKTILSDRIYHYLTSEREMEDGQRRVAGDAIADRIVDAACRGSIDMIKIIFERIEGKVKEVIEVEDKLSKSKEDLLAYLKKATKEVD